jgi:hypothetical protein
LKKWGHAPIKKRWHTGLYFFLSLMGRTTRHWLQFLWEKTNDASSGNSRIRPLMWSKKQGYFFWLKTPRKHRRNLGKPINSLQKHKTPIKPKTKNLPKVRSNFLGVSKVKEHVIITLAHHMKPFDTKIDRFGGLNLPQCQLSLSKPESTIPFSLLH